MTWVLGQGPFVEGSTFMSSWANFQRAVMTSCCGITNDTNLAFQRQRNLEELKVVGDDLPTFFSEFLRLTSNIGLTSDASRLTVLRPKLPRYYVDALAANGEVHTTFTSLRRQVLNIWTLRAGGARTDPAAERKRQKCDKCGKKGHLATVCRSGK
jgi:hypothetical protein